MSAVADKADKADDAVEDAPADGEAPIEGPEASGKATKRSVPDEPPEGYTRIHGSGGFSYPRDVDLGPTFLRYLRDSDRRHQRGKFAAAKQTVPEGSGT